jgi:hypothetical protein
MEIFGSRVLVISLFQKKIKKKITFTSFKFFSKKKNPDVADDLSHK